MGRKNELIRITIALALAFIITTSISNIVFVNHSPVINMQFIATVPHTIQSAFSSLLSALKKPTPTITPSPIPEKPISPMAFITSHPTITPTRTIIPFSSPTAIPTPTRTPTARPTTRPTPSPTNVPPVSCPATSNNNYASISVVSGHTQDASSQPDVNLAVRGYSKTNGDLSIIDMPGDDDGGKAPQFATLFSPKYAPSFVSTYKVYDWNWSSNSKGNPIGNPSVTLLGMAAKPGEGIHVPISQYDIGDGKQVMVLYATEHSITLKYTREDDMVTGYGIHLDNICVDPQLLKLYSSLNASGRSSLPGLSGGQQLGTALSSEIRIAVRDTGNFMDPRVRKDWWRGY